MIEGYASFSIGASEWASKQSLQVFDVTSPYVARTRRFEAGVSYVPYRSSHSKGSLRFTLFRRQENAWIQALCSSRVFRRSKSRLNDK